MKKKVTNNGGVTAIYVRRSVADRDNNSLSIESQKEDCIRYVGEDCVYRLYCDNGFSGKDTEHRPAFQQMMSDAHEGIIGRIKIAHKQKEAPDAEAESIKADILKLDSEIRFGI